MKKGWIFLLAVALLALSACGGGASTSTSAPPANTGTGGGNADAAGTEAKEELKAITIGLGHVGPPNSVIDVAAHFFADKVSEKTNGKFTVEIYPGGQLGGDRDMTESVSNGSLVMAMPNVGVMSNFTQAFSGVQFPYLLDAETEVKLYKSDLIKKEAFAEMEKLNMKGLAMIGQGFLEFGSVGKPFHSLADVKGVAIRSIENDVLIDSYKAFGMNPTPMPYPEMFNALQTGVITAGAIPLSSWDTSGMGEVIDYVTISNAIASPHPVFINLEAFNSYPKEYQDAIVEAALEMEDYALKFEKEYNQKSIDNLQKVGVEIVEMENREQFVEQMQSVYEKYAAKEPWVQRTLDLVKELGK